MKTIIMWGTGSGMINAIKRIDPNQYNILALSDNDKSKYGQFYNGIPVISNEEWARIDCDYIVIASRANKEIKAQLIKEYGLSEDKIYDTSTFYQQVYFNEEHERLLRENDLYKFLVNESHNLIEKWFHYFEIYEIYFSKYRNKEVTILEIGVFKGFSLKMWKNYFGKQANVIGIDINSDCKQYEEEGIMVEIGSQSDSNFWNYIKNKYSKIDILLDDGGHTMEQQIITFEEVFPHIQNNGIYICEDTHTSYWSKYDGGYKKNNTFIEYSKNRIDDMNAWYSETDELTVNDYTKFIKAIHYYDSMVIFEKQNNKFPFYILM